MKRIVFCKFIERNNNVLKFRFTFIILVYFYNIKGREKKFFHII